MADEDEETPTKHFWTSLPGILTGVTGILSALTAMYIAIFGGARAPANDAQKAQVIDAARDKAVPAPSTPPAKPAAADTTPAGDRFTLTAVIDDPDGFVNVRSARSASSDVVARVNRNETFSTYRQQAAWWQVRTRDGAVGYMHVSRIRVLDQK